METNDNRTEKTVHFRQCKTAFFFNGFVSVYFSRFLVLIGAELDDHFLARITAQPDNDEHRLVYADWLEERGDSRARFLRIEIEFHRTDSIEKRDGLRAEIQQLKAQIAESWILKVERLAVELCRQANEPAKSTLFEYQCELDWTDLTTTYVDNVRRCERCDSKVFFCNTIEEAKEQSLKGHCVAICSSQKRKKGDMQQNFDDGDVIFGLLNPETDF